MGLSEAWSNFERGFGEYGGIDDAITDPYDQNITFDNIKDFKSIADAKRKLAWADSYATGAYGEYLPKEVQNMARGYILDQEKQNFKNLGQQMYDEQTSRVAPFLDTGFASAGAFQQATLNPVQARSDFSKQFINSDYGKRQINEMNRNTLSNLEAQGALGGSGAFKQLAAIPQAMADNAYGQRRQDLTYGIGQAMSALGLQGQASGGYQNQGMNLYNQSVNTAMNNRSMAHDVYLQELAGRQQIDAARKAAGNPLNTFAGTAAGTWLGRRF